ncbi:mannitol-1-phosphate 5-dehydrogenase [Mariniphaga anaerophila]|uniref:Mannitol-1-phosphate 5-dehydrogenase n=1 Tax=Mariniphaga anaerophila TaxID=1484053 RepID=A0A1M4STF3_9BACT|nr:hypothetical protein [Mariniphaga anaerophila]SHE35297.1 mannitol-1-phosphate 5-dehydrogenase [Mariniphaga anaerophila]
MKVKKNKLVLFGAGKIGRSFIGQLFSIGGYEVVFVDICKPVIEELNRGHKYRVCFVSDESMEWLEVKNVRGVHAMDEEMAIEEVATAGLLAISVGAGALALTAPSIARGLLKRHKAGNNAPLDIIIAENMANASAYLGRELLKHLPVGFPFDGAIGLVETSIGKMVPLMPTGGADGSMLDVYAEPYNTLIVDKKAFKNPVPEIGGLAPKENIRAWVERKLFVHNMGHSAAAYIGHAYAPGLDRLYEVLGLPEVYHRVRCAMMQSAAVLRRKYPDEFTMGDLIAHVEDLLSRFMNRALGDTVFRVGCDLGRKLGPEDRLVLPIRSAISQDMPYGDILYALVCACRFRAKGPEEPEFEKDRAFFKEYGGDTASILTKVSGLDMEENNDIFSRAKAICKYLATIGIGKEQLIGQSAPLFCPSINYGRNAEHIHYNADCENFDKLI